MANGNVQVPATLESTHQMAVAVLIMGAVGMFAIVLAGQSKATGNAIAGVLAIMLVVQGITRVNPFIEFFANHPLTPVTSNPNRNQHGTPNKPVGRMRAE